MHELKIPDLIITSNARLARGLQQAYAETKMVEQSKSWQPLNIKTLDIWLDEVVNNAILCGEIDANYSPQKHLTALEERFIWQEVIAQSLEASTFADLFDLAGLAKACIEANTYMIAWRLRVSDAMVLAEETRQFLNWQQLFQARCKKLNVLESVRYFNWQIDCIAKNAGVLPASIAFAGFDQSAPQEKRLREVLQTRACVVSDFNIDQSFEAQTEHLVLTDQMAEIRSMVAWAKNQLTLNPNAKLACIVPQLAELRNQLADLLDDVFQPNTVSPHMAEAPRVYNFSLGLPLSEQPIIQAALDLINLWTSYQLSQTDIGQILRSVYWSASIDEADDRALLDAAMREGLAQATTWPRLLRLMQQQASRLNIAHLLEDTQVALQFMQAQKRKQAPSIWVEVFRTLLQSLKWSGQRADSSHEYQAKLAWEKALQQLARLDFLGQIVTAQEASHYLQQICKEQVFQPETHHTTSIQILGMMEALSRPVDAMWVMGMNDDIWPPPARPNPLLPANIQRAARVANADSAVQTEFAQTIHRRLLVSAKTIIFSSSKMQGEKALRASPLMQSISFSHQEIIPANTLAEILAAQGHVSLTQLDDALAPPVEEGEHVRGGTGLIRAQAICPAWAFYQFRLGAKKLKTPKNGLDAAERGQLVHGALEHFWSNGKHYRHFADLIAMNVEAFEENIATAAQNAIQNFTTQQEAVFSPEILALEYERLCKLLANWLAFEKERQVAFNIRGCEIEQKNIDIGGIKVTLKIDRVHQLKDGGLELIDYKTGQIPKIKSWGEPRLKEPQLPIYAVFYAAPNEAVTGIHFGLVKVAEQNFYGVSSQNFEVEIEKRKPEFLRDFEDWASLKQYWKTCIEAMVEEIKTGQAAVLFESESELTYCEVIPLLRLPERQLQYERQRAQDEH